MPGSLSVFKIINPNENKLMREKLNSDEQTTFCDFELNDGLGLARSVLNFVSHDELNKRYHYKAVHYSDTVKNRIRFFLDDVEDSFANLSHDEIKNINKGTKTVDEYQEIHKFDVIIDFNSEEVFVFTKKNIARSFMKRFKKSGHMGYKKIYFSMDKIENVPELADIWGLWEDSSGRCTKKAYFGTKVHRLEGLEPENVTSYNVNYELDNDSIVDLYIMHDCRLSSRSKIINESELFETYTELKKHLGTSCDSRNIIEAYQEDN